MTLASTAFPAPRLSFRRCAATGAMVLGSLFAVCWIASAVGLLTASHMFVALFTTAPMATLAAGAFGLLWALVFGAIAGGLVALSYNATAGFARHVEG